MAMISFFRQQPTLVGCIADRGGGGWFLQWWWQWEWRRWWQRWGQPLLFPPSEGATNAVNGNDDSKDNNNDLVLWCNNQPHILKCSKLPCSHVVVKLIVALYAECFVVVVTQSCRQSAWSWRCLTAQCMARCMVLLQTCILLRNFGLNHDLGMLRQDASGASTQHVQPFSHARHYSLTCWEVACIVLGHFWIWNDRDKSILHVKCMAFQKKIVWEGALWHNFGRQDDVGRQQSHRVMWPSGQALHAYILYKAIEFS
jgi:hypothetical protein